MQAFGQQPNGDIDLILADLAEFLHGEQMSGLALKVLAGASNARPEVLDLHHRIQSSIGQEGRQFAQKPYPYAQV